MSESEGWNHFFLIQIIIYIYKKGREKRAEELFPLSVYKYLVESCPKQYKHVQKTLSYGNKKDPKDTNTP